MLSAAVVALLLAPAADIPVIAPEQAKDRVGQEVVVLGQVTQIGASKSGDTLFLNFGGRYPDHVFNAVIFSRNLQSFPEARSWEQEIIKVRGKIQLYRGKGKPEIILERQEQVTVASSTTPPQGGVPEAVEGGVEGAVGGVLGGVLTGVLGGAGTGPVLDYDSPPRPIKITRPQYPQEAFATKVEGTVTVEILIDSTGRVVRARVLQSVPLLDAAALQTVYQWVFQPAIKGGRPVPTIAHAPITFRITEKAAGAPEQRKQWPATSSKTSIAPQGSRENLGGLYFDPQGADFTSWINHFKNQVYRSWLVPQAALSGASGHVDFEFTVERDGTMSALRFLKASGTPSLDRAAQNALTGSRFAPLPDAYGPPRVTMQVSFFYNEAPSAVPTKDPE